MERASASPFWDVRACKKRGGRAREGRRLFENEKVGNTEKVKLSLTEKVKLSQLRNHPSVPKHQLGGDGGTGWMEGGDRDGTGPMG